MQGLFHFHRRTKTTGLTSCSASWLAYSIWENGLDTGDLLAPPPHSGKEGGSRPPARWLDWCEGVIKP
jgi:hypothetical protein